MGFFDDDEEPERLRGKYRFRAVVRKVVINMSWLAEQTEEAEEAEDKTKQTAIERTMLKAKSRRRREGDLNFTLEERVLFNRPVESRTKEDLEKALGVVKRIRHFAKYPEEVQKGLAKSLTFLYLTDHRTILKEGHEPQSIYFILQGDVLISVERTDPYTNEQYNEHLAILTAGDMFGEVAILYNIDRTATCTSSSVVELLALHKDDFETVLRKTLEAQWQRFRSEIARFSYFDGWTETQIREMCILGRLRSFDKDEIILGDGCGSAEYAYFVLSGSCRLIQTITVEVWEEFGDTVYRLLDDPTLVAVRRLPTASEIKATGRGPDIPSDQLAKQDEWKLAAMRLEVVIGDSPKSPQWRNARAEVERMLVKSEPFKHKTIVHSEEWEQARQLVLDTLGEHTTRAAKRSQSSEQLRKLFGRTAAGGLRSDLVQSGSGSTIGMSSGQAGGGSGKHSALSQLSSLAVLGKQARSFKNVSGRSSEEGRRMSSATVEENRRALELEMVRGRGKTRKKGAARSASRSSRTNRASVRRGSRFSRISHISRVTKTSDSRGTVIAFSDDAETHRSIKLRRAFEDPNSLTPRPRRMSLVSRTAIRNSWSNVGSRVHECLALCEESPPLPEEMDDLRETWRNACKGVERFIKKEQVPVMRPGHRIDCHFVQVCFFTQLQVFGIGESMDQRRIAATSPVECLLLPRYWLDQNNVANVWERVRLYLNRSIPNSRAVFRAWAEERRWLHHRQHVVAEQINRRRIDSSTTPYDVPYSLRLLEISDPHASSGRRTSDSRGSYNCRSNR